MSEPSRKRARTDDGDGDGDSNLPTSALRKDDDVWLSDGSIVVATADHVAFRVHKSTLARRSETFRDLFSLPNVDATAETMEGCPIVRISDLSEDIRHLLLVLCCGKNYYYNGDTLIAVPFEILASLIRMAHKYAVQDVLDHALSRLKKYYTNDLNAWRDAESRARYVTVKEHHWHALTVVELARLTNTPSLLPTAFLQCTMLLTSYLGSDDDVPVAPAIASLPVPDQQMLIGAREHLMHMCAERSLYLVAVVPGIGCTTPVACKTTREAPMMAARNGKGFPGPPLHCRDVLKPMATTFWNDTQWRMFCGGCRASLARVEETMSKWIWSTLPALFGVKELDKDSWPRISADGQA